MLPEKKKSFESYLLLFDKCFENILGCDSHPMYELVYGAKYLLVASKIPVSLAVDEKKSSTREHQARWKTPLYPGAYLHFGRDKAPGDHMSDFQIYSSFGFH